MIHRIYEVDRTTGGIRLLEPVQLKPEVWILMSDPECNRHPPLCHGSAQRFYGGATLLILWGSPLTRITGAPEDLDAADEYLTLEFQRIRRKSIPLYETEIQS